MIGQTISHYKILEKVGEGGMGVVYKAQDTKLDRLVALKFLPPHVSVSEEVRARFLQEAKAAAALNHPNICTIYGVDEHDGHFFIAMEIIEGGTLRQTISKRQHSIEDYCTLGIQIGEALQSAHAKDIVHRDIKSENIMLTSTGQTKIMDFGLAKLKGSLKLTKTSSTVGTLGYMAPEQIQGGQVDHRSDIFSFGVLMFEMLTGKMPFRGEHEAAMVYSIVNEEPANITQIVPSISPIVANLIGRCLEKDPNDRYQSMQDAVIELRRSLKQTSKIHHASSIQSSSAYQPPTGGISTPGGSYSTEIPASPSTRLPWKIIGGAGAILILGLMAFLLFGMGDGRISYDMNDMELISLPTEGSVRSLGLSPDGQYVVYMTEQSGIRTIRAKHLASGSIVEVLPPTSDFVGGIEFGGASTHFFFLSKDPKNSLLDVLNTMPVLGGPVRALRTLENLDAYSISDDGKKIAYTRTFSESGEFSLMISDLDGSDEKVLATDKGPKWYHSQPAWSPDGKTIVCPWGTTIGSWKHTVKVIDVQTSEVSDIVERGWKTVSSARWLPDGKGILLRGNETSTGNPQIWEVSYPEGNVKRFTNDVNNYWEIEVSNDGTLLASGVIDVKHTIMILESPSMKTVSTLTSSTQDGRDGIDWTPDGKLVFTSVTNSTSNIWLMDMDGSSKKQLTFGEFSDFQPSVSRDGQDIAFVSDRSGQINIWRIRSNGTDVRKVSVGNEHYNPAFSPDKNWIYFSSWDLGPFHVMRMPADGGDAIQLSIRPGGAASVSPDGKSLLYQSMSGDSAFIIPSTGGEPIASIPALGKRRSFRWHPGSQSITFLQVERPFNQIWEAFVDGRPPQKLFEFKDREFTEFSWSPDGKYLALVMADVSTNIILFKKRQEVSN